MIRSLCVQHNGRRPVGSSPRNTTCCASHAAPWSPCLGTGGFRRPVTLMPSTLACVPYVHSPAPLRPQVLLAYPLRRPLQAASLWLSARATAEEQLALGPLALGASLGTGWGPDGAATMGAAGGSSSGSASGDRSGCAGGGGGAVAGGGEELCGGPGDEWRLLRAIRKVKAGVCGRQAQGLHWEEAEGCSVLTRAHQAWNTRYRMCPQALWPVHTSLLLRCLQAMLPASEPSAGRQCPRCLPSCPSPTMPRSPPASTRGTSWCGALVGCCLRAEAGRDPRAGPGRGCLGAWAGRG